jgi:hypothetical protein
MANQIAGTNISIDLTLQTSAGAAQDLDGATLTWRLTRAYSVPGVLDITPTPTNPPGSDGLVTVNLDATESLDLQGTYYHEIKADFGANQEKTWQLGIIEFSESSVAAD